MNIKPFMRVAVEYAVFLGTSEDQTVQPDSAISQLEQLAVILQELGGLERKQVRQFVQQIAEDEESESGRTPRVDFLLSLTDNLGLNCG